VRAPRDAVHHGGQHAAAMAMIRAWSPDMASALERLMADKGPMAIYDGQGAPLTAFYAGVVFALANAAEFRVIDA